MTTNLTVRPPRFGMGTANLDDDGTTWLPPAQLARALLARFRAPDYRPPVLPAEAVELLALARQPNVAYASILTLLERDPLLAARVLQRAQSAAYASRGSIQSLRDALVRLGLTTLTGIFLETAMNLRVFRAPGYEAPMAQLQAHSAATAHICRIVCRRTAICDEYAFLCGLLHDVGLAAMMLSLADRPRGAPLPDFEQVWPGLREAHEEASAMLCRLWRLPPDIELALSCHHSGRLDGHLHPLGSAIALAERLAARLGRGFRDEAQADESHLLEVLGIAPRVGIEILDEARGALATLDA